MRKIGYARVSTVEQNLQMQIRALKAAECVKIYHDKGISGALPERAGLNAALKVLQPGDMLVVWRLDRLGRSLLHLVDLIDSLSRQKIEFQSLTESIDTSSAGGRLVFHIMAALAEFERHLISERTVAGMEAARQKGNHLGRPSVLTDAQRLAAARAVINEGKRFADVASHYNVHHCTIRRIVADARARVAPPPD